jgi:hypothetical protein
MDLVPDPERDGDYLAKPPRQGAARRSPHDLAEQEAEGLGLVAEAAARLPPGLGLGEHRAHVVPVAQLLDRGVVRRGGHARGVQQHVPERDPVLAVGTELGPDVGGPQVVGGLAPLHQYMGDGQGHALRCGCSPEQRVGTHGLALARVRGTAHRIHHDPAVLHHRDLHSNLVAARHPVVDQRLDTCLHIGSAHAVILSSTIRPKRVTRSSAGDEPSGKQRAESADRPDKRDGQAHKDGQGGRDKPGGHGRGHPGKGKTRLVPPCRSAPLPMHRRPSDTLEARTRACGRPGLPAPLGTRSPRTHPLAPDARRRPGKTPIRPALSLGSR